MDYNSKLGQVIAKQELRIAELQHTLKDARARFLEIRRESMWAKDVSAEEAIAAIDAILKETK